MQGYEADGYFMVGGLFWFVVALFFLWLYSRILSRAGFSGWWALLSLVPILNLVMLWVFAFVDWPSQRRQGGPEGL